MSPATKSKSKDKKANKESQKAASKPSVPASAGSGIPASGYNPLLGTFHALELSPTSSASVVHTNGRFRNIDETDDHSGSSHAAGVEYDSVSNNGSWSGESEDHRDKTSGHPVKQETIPGGDIEKREKIRQKNEKKHQRQKEKRAQELRERCSGYLMSRKLEKLAQQLVAMGVSQERATMALILNEGSVEESVSWLFDGDEEAEKLSDQNLARNNLKIDISEELAMIADMEIRFKCSKQEVERAVVTCEGDLEKAAESLRALNLDTPSAPLKPEETGDPPIFSNGKLSVAVNQNLRPQAKSNHPPTIPQRRDDKDFIYAKPTVAALGSSESVSKNLQPLKRVQPKVEWAKTQQAAIPVEKRWPNSGSNPSVSYSLVSPLQVSSSPAKPETHFVPIGNEMKNLPAGTVREPVIMMQRPQSLNTKQVQASMSSSLPGTAASWYPTNSIEVLRSSGFLPQISNSRGLSPDELSSNQMYHQFMYQQQQHVPGSNQGDSAVTNRGNGLWSSRTGASPTLAPASSLGLFSGLGSAGSSGASSPVDWSTANSTMHFDYNHIDWSLDRGLRPPRSNGLWQGLTSYANYSTNFYEPKASGLATQPAMRSSASPNVNSISIAGLQDGGAVSPGTPAVAAGARDWTSPFEGEDLFSVPRQFVSSPSL